MSEQQSWLRYASFPEEASASRIQLREKLGITECLKKRKAFRLGEQALHVEVYESDLTAPVLLFLPGIGTYSELYAELLSLLCEQGFNVVAVDLRGHGYSGGRRGEFTVTESVADLQLLIDHLTEKYTGEINVFGYSLGAVIGLALAEQDDRVRQLVCGTLLAGVCPPDLFHQLGWQWTRASAFWMPGLRIPLGNLVDYKQLLKGHPAAAEIDADGRMVYEYPLSALDSVFSWQHRIFSAPQSFRMAIVHGEQDEVLPVHYSEELARKSSHPIDLILIQGQGHMLPWYQPDNLSQQVCQWLQEG